MSTPEDSGLCAAWVAASDLSAASTARLSDAEVSTTDRDRGLLIASELLYRLSGRRWRGAGCSRTVEITAGHRGELGRVGSAQARGSLCSPGALLPLPDYPVTSITSVSVDGTALDSDLYRLESGREVRRLDADGASIPWSGTTVVIAYAYGAPPPPGGVLAAELLGVELALALAGSTLCQLPSRVREITRQGVTMMMLDPQAFLDKGRTGLTAVDLWLAAVNPLGARRRATVWSPDTDARITTRITG